MNRRMVFHTVGQMLKVEGLLMVLPAIVSLIYGEKCFWAFVIAVAVAVALGYFFTLTCRSKNRVIFAKEGFVTVALAWVFLSLVGALPFVISGDIPSYVDAFFETVSGFTTTGASILTDVEALSRGALFWRSFTHWVGGMGILVFIVAVIPMVSDRNIHILRAEMPGPTMGKLVPRLGQTAKILYLIYMIMTVVQIIMLLCGGMPLFESCIYSFGTAGTGGFAVNADCLAGYSSYIQWVITIFMLLFGVNFNLYYMILIRRVRSVARSDEFWCYLAFFVLAAAAITVNILPLYENVSDCIRLAAFQVSSVMTTTGYATADFNLWPDFSKAILLILMFVGGCAGSTAGGLKVSRVVMLFKLGRREMHKLLHPRSVRSVRLEGKKLDDSVLYGVGSYLAVYMLLFFLLFLIISFEPFGFETNFTAVATCINNVGPGFGMVGPAGSFAAYSGFPKIILSIAMLLGRLEIYPLLICLTPSTWTKK